MPAGYAHATAPVAALFAPSPAKVAIHRSPSYSWMFGDAPAGPLAGLLALAAAAGARHPEVLRHARRARQQNLRQQAACLVVASVDTLC
ncbi:MAG: hypothetical protein IPI02_06550 [Sterolibacteriaceae bacterium]|nr:hypothetical protein [Sterolibacteriaceae bacterium]